MNFAGIFLVSKAPNGAAKTPPINNPRMTRQCVSPIVRMNVIASARVTKNSEKFTDPIVFLGVWPDDINVEVTIGPQPPPPMASKVPPIKPNGINKLVFGSRSFSLF